MEDKFLLCEECGFICSPSVRPEGSPCPTCNSTSEPRMGTHAKLEAVRERLRGEGRFQ